MFKVLQSPCLRGKDACGRWRFQKCTADPNDIDDAVKGTCDWLPHHETYKNWSNLQKGLLWIKGKPGSGKSTLLKHVLRQAEAEPPTVGDSATILSFFFHGRGVELQKTPLGLFRSLLYQLLVQVPDAVPHIVDAFQHRCDTIGAAGEKWEWHERELRGLFESALPKVTEGSSSLRLFVDALDECGEESASRLVDDFERLILELPPTSRISICFSCRHYPILKLEYGMTICPEDENAADIAAFVKTQLSARWVGAAAASMADTIADKITSRASGVFMWACLVVKRVFTLVRRGEGIKKIQAEIERIPPDLDALYNGLVQSMEPIPMARKLMEWICFTTRPLSVDQLRWAMAVDLNCLQRSLQECEQSDEFTGDNETMDRRIKTLSCGLAETVPAYRSRTVQFIHQSVKDFFLEKGLSALAASDNGRQLSNKIAIGYAHHRMAQVCIRYFVMEEVGRWVSPSRLAHLDNMFPLLYYATTMWVYHARQGELNGACQVDLQYFGWPSEIIVPKWRRIYRTFAKSSSDCPSETTSLLHVASRYGFKQLLSALVQREDQSRTGIDGRDDFGRTPLSWAAGEGHWDIVKLLLDTRKVDVNAADEHNRTPLWLATERGDEAIVALLLNTANIDIDLRHEDGRTPLWLAAKKGHLSIFRLLLDAGAVNIDVNSREGENHTQTLLWLATESGDEAKVTLLLGTGKMNADRSDNSRSIPVAWVSEEVYETMVNVLLDNGKVDVSVMHKDGRTPPWWTAIREREAIVKLLLDAGKVNINARDIAAFASTRSRAEGSHKQLDLNAGAVGLRNLVNTGWLNAVMQCLRSVEELTKFFLTGAYVDEVNKDNILGYGGKVAIGYGSLLKEMYAEGKASVSPTKFKATVGKCRSTFAGYHQQDAFEFLMFLLDGLQEDLSRINRKPYIEPPEATDDMINNPDAIMMMAEKTWDIHLQRNDSIIVDLFTGMYRSILKCPECGKTSIAFDPCTSLTLPLPRKIRKSKPQTVDYQGTSIITSQSMLGRPAAAPNTSDRSHVVTLNDCLDEFEREVILPEIDQWYCPRCKTYRRGSKKFNLWKAPDILVLHLKRVDSSVSRYGKINDLVDFPIDGLDITSRVLQKDDKDHVYDLVGVIDHNGGTDGSGIYTASTRNFVNGHWYSYRDLTVSYIPDPRTVVTPAAYILLYRRRSSAPSGRCNFKIIQRNNHANP